ncbi:uncharacterized protein N7459_005661 [Penicillium hispanicum]|uniref:uncharacterized protein n=1 Tax=Penicillium hispanicum TaxID=1080232 RepID=UPI002540B700|nr:uncharacterized protein N7459_005661 [Penicillium hispanicum]KAJ5579676.1 hypothetical protein N7459_005661 [Penicillium hispanicum]
MHHSATRSTVADSAGISAGASQSHRSVFRVPNCKPNKISMHGSSDELVDRAFHSRRPHRKSRGGCSTCKHRRVKCDETKPTCLKCQKHGSEYVYTASPARPPPVKHVVTRSIESRPELMSVDTMASSMSLLMVAEKLDELLRPEHTFSNPRRQSRAGLPSMDRVLRSLQHFHYVTSMSDKTKPNTTAVMSKVTQLTFEKPFLMHALIGAAISHLCIVLPDNSSYRVAEAYHWQQTIEQCSTERPLRRLDEYNPRSSFVFSQDPAALNWLQLQGGLRFLLERTATWLPGSMWWTTFMESRRPDLDFEDNRPGRIDLDPAFADLCAINETSTVENNPYLCLLRMLTHLLPLERKPESFSQYNTWMGRLEPPYFGSLLRKEPPALVLLAWWHALIFSADEWWVETRVRSECTAICMRLEDSSDPLVLQLLEFPANTRGYLLRHVEERQRVQAAMVSVGFLGVDEIEC